MVGIFGINNGGGGRAALAKLHFILVINQSKVPILCTCKIQNRNLFILIEVTKEMNIKNEET